MRERSRRMRVVNPPMSESLADAGIDAEAQIAGLAVERDGAVYAQRAERRHVAQADARAEAQIVEIRNAARRGGASVYEWHDTQCLRHRHAQFGGRQGKRHAPGRGSVRRARADALICVSAHRSATPGIETAVRGYGR